MLIKLYKSYIYSKMYKSMCSHTLYERMLCAEVGHMYRSYISSKMYKEHVLIQSV